MATSGWQDEKTWYTYNSNVWLIGNIRVDSIVHSGTNLRIQGVIAAGTRGASGYGFYFSDYTSYAQPEGGQKIALGTKGRWWKVGQDDIHVGFDVTISGVAYSTTYIDFHVNFYGPNTSSVQSTLTYPLTFDPSGTAPSGGYNTFQSTGWDSANDNWPYVNCLAGVSSWGGISGAFESIIVVGTYNGDCANITTVDGGGRRVYRYEPNNTNVTTHQFTCRQNNTLVGYGDPIWLYGLTHYKLGYWHWNSAGVTSGLDQTIRYMQPAPPVMTYTDPGGSGTKDYAFSFTGNTDRNQSSYDSASLTRTIRYKVNNAAEWTYVLNDSVVALTDTTTFTVRVPGTQSAVVEGWMTYHGQQSLVKTTTIYNGNAPSMVYGSVNGVSKRAVKAYVSVNGQSKRAAKIYASVNGKSKAVMG